MQSRNGMVLTTRWCMQGEVKPALARLHESRAARARELSEEVLAVQERLDAGQEALTERTEDNATLGTQVLLMPLCCDLNSRDLYLCS